MLKVINAILHALFDDIFILATCPQIYSFIWQNSNWQFQSKTLNST
jgi:hypothetical protein